ncbi:MAG TPA: hypothetical protein VE860_01970, partial [Chthoniobacterales bacterium]|nr:hypothetical protein [Chthoniobacterales bacterium]
MVVFTDQTTTDVKKLTIRFELVLYEKGVIEGVSLSETMKTTLESKSIRTTPRLGTHANIVDGRIDEIMFDIHIVR